jgi:hypothetical protein
MAFGKRTVILDSYVCSMRRKQVTLSFSRLAG